MKHHRSIFFLLIVAYGCSMAYQYYRFCLRQYPEFDTFGLQEIIVYALFFAWSGLALIARRWAMWAILGLCSLQLLIGILYYLPVIFAQRHDTFWDWAECVVFIFLITLAGKKALDQLKRYKRNSSGDPIAIYFASVYAGKAASDSAAQKYETGTNSIA